MSWRDSLVGTKDAPDSANDDSESGRDRVNQPSSDDDDGEVEVESLVDWMMNGLGGESRELIAGCTRDRRRNRSGSVVEVMDVQERPRKLHMRRLACGCRYLDNQSGDSRRSTGLNLPYVKECRHFQPRCRRISDPNPGTGCDCHGRTSCNVGKCHAYH